MTGRHKRWIRRTFDAEGANLALLEARKAGKLRYIGFTGHKDPRIHLYTLEIAHDHGFTFDTVQMPLNVMDAHYRSFAQLVVLELVKQNIGVGPPAVSVRLKADATVS